MVYIGANIMEKIWKKAEQNEYQKCFDILNSESLIERETYKKFATELFAIAKKQLDCKDCKLRFIESEKNDLGFASVLNNSVTLNLNKMEKHTLYKTVSTIYHELTHIRQDTTENKKKLETFVPAEFPFIRCSGNEKFLPANLLGISPFLFYYTCQHEKQARDVGSECAMELFVELKNIAHTKPAKNGTIRLIERCINQIQLRWDKENENNNLATAQINAFFNQNPNFLQDAFNKIKQEFVFAAIKYNARSKERAQIENRFNCRVGSLVLMGCDNNLKKQILDFVASNFVNKGEIFNTLISVVDSPYSITTANEINLLIKFAEINNCPKETLLNFLVSWDKNYMNKIINNLYLLNKNQNNVTSLEEIDLDL